MLSKNYRFQNNQESQLDSAERRACKTGLVTHKAIQDSEPSEPLKKKYKSVLAAKKAQRESAATLQSKYSSGLKNCVLSSAAEVERLWSMADPVLTKRRMTMSPLVFECIMYLKYNADLWDINDVVEANKRRKNESDTVKNRLQSHRKNVGSKVKDIGNWDEFYEALEAVEANAEDVIQDDEEAVVVVDSDDSSGEE